MRRRWTVLGIAVLFFMASTLRADAAFDTFANSLVSRVSNSFQQGGNGAPGFPSISDDGRFVAFDSTGTNHVAGFTDNNSPLITDVYLLDTQNGSVTLLSFSTSGPAAGGNGFSGRPVISGDGAFVVFMSGATDLVTGVSDPNAAGTDLYVYDVALGTRKLVTHTATSTTTTIDAGVTSNLISVSADGDKIAYQTSGTNVIDDFVDSNNFQSDIYVYDRSDDASQLVTHQSDDELTGSDGPGTDAKVSPDGKSIAFLSTATTLVKDFANNNGSDLDLYVYTTKSRKIALGSHASTGKKDGSNGAVGGVGLNDFAIGNKAVGYAATGTDLVKGFTNNNATGTDIYRYDIKKKSNALASHSVSSKKAGGNGPSTGPLIDDAGRRIAYGSSSTDLDGLVGAAQYVYLYDSKSKKNVIVSHTPGTEVGVNSPAHLTAFDGDGAAVAFSSAATDVIPSFANGNGSGADQYLYEVSSDSTALVTRNHTNGFQGGNGNSGNTGVAAAMAADGTFVYASLSTDLVLGFVDNNTAGTLDLWRFGN